MHAIDLAFLYASMPLDGRTLSTHDAVLLGTHECTQTCSQHGILHAFANYIVLRVSYRHMSYISLKVIRVEVAFSKACLGHCVPKAGSKRSPNPGECWQWKRVNYPEYYVFHWSQMRVVLDGCLRMSPGS